MVWVTVGVLAGVAGALAEGPVVELRPSVTYVKVNGDEAKFREDWWLSDGWTGGVEEFTLDQVLKGDWKCHLEGRAIFDENDYRLDLQVIKPELLYVRAGYTEYRKFSDDTGGYYQFFSVPSFDLAKELQLDMGRLYVEVGLIKPDAPKLTVGYERQTKDGTKSLLEWGSVSETVLGLGATSRKIYPSYKDIDETTDIIKASISHTIAKINVGDDFRYEKYDSDTARFDSSLDLDALTGKTVTIRENYDQDSLFNTFHMDSHLNEKVYWSLGYLYNDADGDGGIQVSTPPPLTAFDKNWATRVMDVESTSHVLNLNLMVGPFAGCNFYGGLQAESTDSDGYTVAEIVNGLNPLTVNEIATVNEQDGIEEFVGIRFTKIPWTTLYAEGRWEQGTVDLFERERVDGLQGFRRQTDSDVRREDYTIGFNTAPVSKVTLSGRYRHKIHENEYDHEVDTEAAYPAFITGQDFTTDEAMAKMTVRPWTRLSLSLSYQLVATDIDTVTQAVPVFIPGGGLQSGNYDANVYSVSATVTPLARLYLTGLFSFQDTRTEAYDNGVAAVQTYQGDVYTAIGTAGYALNAKTDLTLQYTFSWAENFEDNSVDGLPLGLDNERHGLIVSLVHKFTENITAQLRYGFYKYDENSNGGVDDYTAHLASASCSIHF
jgi:hypothetical protein